MAKEHLEVRSLEGYPQRAGSALWALQDTRERTLSLVSQEVDPASIDLVPWPGANSIGALLYHIAAIELDWLYSEILQRDDYPEAIVDLFPTDVRDDAGMLVPASGESLDRHLKRLHSVRDHLLDRMRTIDEADFGRTRILDDYDVSPEWVIHHLCQHEAEHRGQMGEISRFGSNAG